MTILIIEVISCKPGVSLKFCFPVKKVLHSFVGLDPKLGTV